MIWLFIIIMIIYQSKNINNSNSPSDINISLMHIRALREAQKWPHRNAQHLGLIFKMYICSNLIPLILTYIKSDNQISIYIAKNGCKNIRRWCAYTYCTYMHIFINVAPDVHRCTAPQEEMMLIYEKAEKYLSDGSP